MHEYSIAQALLGKVDREVTAHGGDRVLRVWVRIGELSGVEPELLQTAYRICRDATRCAEAPLEIEQSPVRWECSSCGAVVEAGARLECRTCGRPARLAAGDEIVLERIEMEVA